MDLIGQHKETLDTPALIVDLDVLQRNINKMVETIILKAKVGWRPHTKGMKIPELAKLCLDSGALGITCAKLSEAEVMANSGIRDILVANQIVGKTKIDRLVKNCKHSDIMVCVDNIENVKEINHFAKSKKVKPRLLVEVDVGMCRAGVLPGDPAVHLAKQINALDHVRFAGLQTWEAHALKIKDANKKRRTINSALELLIQTARQIRKMGISVDIISCGGTGTYWISAFKSGVTEIEAGGGIFCDIRYRKDFGVEHEYSLKVLSTVTSRPNVNRIICDAGFKTFGSYATEPEVVGFDSPKSLKLSAEHGTITFNKPNNFPKIGEKIEFIPGYSDSIVFLHDYMYGIRNNRIEKIWPILGRGKLH